MAKAYLLRFSTLVKFILIIAILFTPNAIKYSYSLNFFVHQSNFIKDQLFLKENLLSELASLRGKINNQLMQFYRENNFLPAWKNKDGELSDNAKALVETLKNANQEGLKPQDYYIAKINALINEINNNSISEVEKENLQATLDITLTKAFFLYASHMYNGVNNYKNAFPYWKNMKESLNLGLLLKQALINSSIKESLADLEPTYSQYQKLKAKLNEYEEMASRLTWPIIPKGETLKLGSKGKRVELLQQRLFLSGELSHIKHKGKFSEEVKEALTKYQENNGLYVDGELNEETLNSLNVPLKYRIQQIKLNMDKMRLLPKDLGKTYIMVNLPDFSLDLLDKGRTALAMDVAIGDVKHPSCVLNSKIEYVVINPYWYLPNNIATEELWPKLKKDYNILKEKQVDVLEKTEKGYKVINADNIDWAKIDPSEFSKYKFRQAPSEMNSLGKVKFIFNNPCQIYLHAALNPEVFDLYKRDFSHGCIRVSEPFNLAYYLLNNEKSYTEDKVKYMFEKEFNKTILLAQPINIYLVYFTTWVDDQGILQFRDDIYKLDFSTSSLPHHKKIM